VTTAIIVQARMGSSRLPGKVLLDIAGRPALDHVLRRCAAVPGADVVVCAVPDETASAPIEALARSCGAQVFRGSESDVLARYLGAARAVGARRVMRVTSDCPLIDPAICGEVLALQARTAADYTANNLARTFPHGLDCEAFTTDVLAKAAEAAAEPFDREHVTPWLRRAPHLTRANLPCGDVCLAEERWTLDYPEDLAFLRAVFAALPAGSAGAMADVLTVLASNPALRDINAGRRVPAAG
jgi:glutamate-1-semialdehyde 2,1-aminomutase/spore coat polysaccharide biosynthesis protein SpsF